MYLELCKRNSGWLYVLPKSTIFPLSWLTTLQKLRVVIQMKKIYILIFTVFLISCSKKSFQTPNEAKTLSSSSNDFSKKIDGLTLLKDDSALGMRGLYFFYDGINFSENEAKKLIKEIRREYPFTCNITIIDDKNILNKVDDPNLKGSDYCYVADHFICMSTFDLPDEAWYYPFQDFLYEEYGGKNKK